MATKANLDKALFYYPWYYKDWGSSRAVIRMNLAERGLYRELIDCCWDQGSIPDDPEKLIELINCDDEEFHLAWPRVRKNFDEAPDGTLVNAKIELVREETQTKRRVQQEKGKIGGEASAAKRAAALSAGATALSEEPEKKSKSNESSSTTQHIEAGEGQEIFQDEKPKQAPTVPKAVPQGTLVDKIHQDWNEAIGKSKSGLMKPGILSAERQVEVLEYERNPAYEADVLDAISWVGFKRWDLDKPNADGSIFCPPLNYVVKPDLAASYAAAFRAEVAKFQKQQQALSVPEPSKAQSAYEVKKQERQRTAEEKAKLKRLNLS